MLKGKARATGAHPKCLASLTPAEYLPHFVAHLVRVPLSPSASLPISRSLFLLSSFRFPSANRVVSFLSLSLTVTSDKETDQPTKKKRVLSHVYRFTRTAFTYQGMPLRMWWGLTMRSPRCPAVFSSEETNILAANSY